jgi:uncharacterized iron-regulated membrane protein
MRWTAIRTALQTVHLWAGLILSIPFIVIGITGSLLVLAPDVPRLEAPVAPAAGPPQPLARVIGAAKRSAPEGWSVSALDLPRSAHAPATVQLQYQPGRRRPGGFSARQGRIVYVDPVSLKILGTGERRRANGFVRTLAGLHIALMVPDYYGARIVGWMGGAMVLFGLSGLVLWWPRRGGWRHAFLIRRGARGFRLHRDLHGVIGFWSLAVFLIVNIGGVYLAFPVGVTNLVSAFAPVDVSSGLGEPDGLGPPTPASGRLTPDDAVRLAVAAVPGSVASAVQLPPAQEDVYMVTLVAKPYGWDSPQISVFLGPGPVVTDVVDPRTYPFAKRVLAWLRVMHYGQGLGIIWHALVFLSGFLPLLFAITGFRMWQLKRANRRRTLAAVPAPAE